MKKLNHNYFISEIKNFNEKYKHFNDDELKLEILKEKKKIKENQNFINQINICNWFALVQEISYRSIGLKHYEPQLLAGFYLNQGNIVEMKTGEGKTLVSTLPASLNAIFNKSVHIITVNEYLAQRDNKWMNKIYKKLDLTVGLVKANQSSFEKKKNYSKDITYVTNSEVVFDYLRDKGSKNILELVQDSYFYCLIDEIDSILIDEARTPLILSKTNLRKDEYKLLKSRDLIELLKKDIDFEIDEKRKEINLTDEGYNIILKKLQINSLYNLENPWSLQILNALKAKYLYKLNKDYIVLNEKICIIDEFTGRIMPDRRWSNGLHDAIEAKEKIKFGLVTETQSSITYQTFFPLYPKLSGMTGTAFTDQKEFFDIYKLKVIRIPTLKPICRKDFDDIIYQNELSKWKAVLSKAKICYKKGQPLLIGTSSIEKSEFLSQIFIFSKLPHKVLNAKPENIQKESEIIAEAGKKSAITIATNMAGRGTDIILGGTLETVVKQKVKKLFFHFFFNIKNNKYFLIIKKIINQYGNDYQSLLVLKKDIQNIPNSLEFANIELKGLYNLLISDLELEWKKQQNYIKQIGGLFVLGTERAETRRIDNQLRGRAGRQGDPGSSQFFLSLDDELIKIFGGERLKKWANVFLDTHDLPLDASILSQSIEQAQKKLENYNFEIRKNIIDYEKLLNSQRKIFYLNREFILFYKTYFSSFLRLAESYFHNHFYKNKFILANKSTAFFSNSKNLIVGSNFYNSSNIFSKKNISLLPSLSHHKLIFNELWSFFYLRQVSLNLYQKNLVKNIYTKLFLKFLDHYWVTHINHLTYIRETINWMAYGQQNPLDEYNYQTIISFDLINGITNHFVLYYFLRHDLSDFNYRVNF